MTDYRSNIDLPEAARKIRRAGRIGMTTHAKPDGDAFGSVVALASALGEIGLSVSAWFIPPVPAIFNDLKGIDRVENFNESVRFPELDLFIVLDTGAWSQLSPMREQLTGVLDRTLIIDHHTTGGLPAAFRYIDTQAAACCEIVAQLIERLQEESEDGLDLFTPTVCEALFAGVATDTGWFRFSNTRPQSHDLVARMLRLGVDQSEMYRKLEQSARPEKLALQLRALDSLRLLMGNRVAIMVLKAEDFLETGAKLDETERFVDIPQSVSTVELVVLITEPPPHHKKRSITPPNEPNTPAPIPPSQAVRLSFRSKPGPYAIDVAQLAAQFGGGGHTRAAGAKLAKPVEEVVQEVEKALAQAMDSAQASGDSKALEGAGGA